MYFSDPIQITICPKDIISNYHFFFIDYPDSLIHKILIYLESFKID